jgi:calmodulin
MMSADDSRQEWREAFSLFDKSGKGSIAAKTVGDLLRALGQNPTMAELKDLLKEVADDDESPVTFDQFVAMLNRPGGWDAKGTLEEFIQGFQVFDKDGSGYLPVGELRYGKRSNWPNGAS